MMTNAEPSRRSLVGISCGIAFVVWVFSLGLALEGTLSKSIQTVGFGMLLDLLAMSIAFVTAIWALVVGRGRTVGLLALLVILLGPLPYVIFHSGRASAQREVRKSKLRMLHRGLKDYEEVNGALPASAACDPSGRPLLSWRVFILPQMFLESRLEKFSLTESWDSRSNQMASLVVPWCFVSPGHSPEGKTCIVAAVCPGGPFPSKCVAGSLKNVPQGSVLLIEVESAQAVPWAMPDDVLDPTDPLAGLSEDAWLVTTNDDVMTVKEYKAQQGKP